MPNTDAAYLQIILDPIRVCARYKPKFGQGDPEGLTLPQFQTLYQTDPFYNWFGLSNPLMYAAHKAAGGMTSVYRQIGIGCEHLVRQILQDSLGLSREAVRWSYQVTTPAGKTRTLSLDGCVPLDQIANAAVKRRFHDWMTRSAQTLGVTPPIISTLTGTVFEVRQGYKSKDSKRQNADIANAATAYIKAYFPCAIILSSQIDTDILARYRTEKWAVLTGLVGLNDPLSSTYDFFKDIIGYDLAAFFERNSTTLRSEIDTVLRALLTPETP